MNSVNSDDRDELIHIGFEKSLFDNGIQAEKPPWKFDVLNVTYASQTPDKLDLKIKITQPSRGVNALSGWIEIKEDITDDVFIEIQLLYSKTGTGNSYSPTPFRMHKMNTTQFINWPYKEYLLDTVRGCAENYVEIEDEPFVAPVTKRRISFDDCVFDTEKLPTMMKNGFYKMEINVSNDIIGHLQAAKPIWKFDILDVKCDIQTPDKIEMKIKIAQPARGVYAINGYIDIREDGTDEAFFEIGIFYSRTGTGNSYTPTPFHLRKMNLSEFINWPYKEYLFGTIKECGENIVEVEDKFVPPLQKRRLILNECIFNTDNMPSMMKNGFYKLEVLTTQQFQLTLSILAQVYDSIY
ncbi:hypothetical protein GQX74_007794 [Glossina fuscipes]|nr:hypothetical protein GQX74_007794 [Glossina fuscipes]